MAEINKLYNIDRVAVTISPILDGPTNAAIEDAAYQAALDAVFEATEEQIEAAKAANASHGHQEGWDDDAIDAALSLLATEAVEQVVPSDIAVSVEVKTVPAAK